MIYSCDYPHSTTAGTHDSRPLIMYFVSERLYIVVQAAEAVMGCLTGRWVSCSLDWLPSGPLRCTKEWHGMLCEQLQVSSSCLLQLHYYMAGLQHLTIDPADGCTATEWSPSLLPQFPVQLLAAASWTAFQRIVIAPAH